MNSPLQLHKTVQQAKVESLIERAAYDLLDRTGNLNVPRWAELTEKLTVIEPLVKELVWDTRSDVVPIGPDRSRAGDEREPEGLSNQQPAQKGSVRPR